MKVYKYLLGFALVAMGVAATSCNTDNEGALYNSPVENVTFETAEPATVTTAESSITVPVRIIRANKHGTYTAHYTAEASDADVFSDDANGTVTFADGEAVKIVNVTASNMVKGKEYTYEMTLSDADVATADPVTDNMNASTTVTIMCDYNWIDAGTCTFIDYTWYTEPVDAEVPLIQAEGTNIYRAVSPLFYLYDGLESGPDKSNFEFTYDGRTVSISDGIYMNWWGYKMYYASASYPSYCFIEQAGDKTWGFNFLLLNGTSLYTGGYFEMALDF